MQFTKIDSLIKSIYFLIFFQATLVKFALELLSYCE
jgi:hypothetical protein